MLTLVLLAAAALEYRAVGTEPFWSLAIGGGRMWLEQVGWRTIVVRTPAPRSTVSGRRYVTRAIRVAIERRSCSDGMSDRRFPETVTVIIGRRVLHGCGGTPVGTH